MAVWFIEKVAYRKSKAAEKVWKLHCNVSSMIVMCKLVQGRTHEQHAHGPHSSVLGIGNTTRAHDVRYAYAHSHI